MKKYLVRFSCAVLAAAVILSAGAGNFSAYAAGDQVMVETTAGNEEAVDVNIEISKTGNSDGSVNVHTEVSVQDDRTDSGMIVDYQGSSDMLVSPDGAGVGSSESEYFVSDAAGTYNAEGGSESTATAEAPQLTVDIPLTDTDDPSTPETDNVSSAETSDPAGTVTGLTGDIKTGEDDGKYNYTQTTVEEQGSVTVTTTDFSVVSSDTSGETDMSYVYGSVEPTADNDLVNGIDPELPVDTESLEVADGFTHVLLGGDTFSAFGAALVCTEGYEGEEPVFVKDGIPYYVQADHSMFEKRKLYVDDRYIDGECINEKTYARWDYIQQFLLVDAQTGELVTTYCADQKTNTQDDYSYVMENLEDADYYDKDMAAMIRSVALNGYWNTEEGFGSLDDVREKLSASGDFTEEELSALTEGMAMTATQYALWTFSNVSNGDKYINSYAVSQKLGVGRVAEEDKDKVDLIFKLYNHLINLEPTKADGSSSDTIINEKNFVRDASLTVIKKAPSHVNNQDTDFSNDAYVTNLSFALVITPDKDGDDLTVEVVGKDGTVVASGRIAGQAAPGETLLNADSEGNYTFTNIVLTEGQQQFNITLQGVQHLSEGVYLYSSEIREGLSSQTMVGVAEGDRSVDISMDISFELSVDDEIVVTERVWRNEWNVPGSSPYGGGKDSPDPEEPEEVELAEVPKTGDNSQLYTISALLSGLMLALLQLSGRNEARRFSPLLSGAGSGLMAFRNTAEDRRQSSFSGKKRTGLSIATLLRAALKLQGSSGGLPPE